MRRSRPVHDALLLGVVLALPAGIHAEEATAPWVPTVGTTQFFAVRVSDADRSALWYARTFGLRELDRAAAEDGSWQIVNLTSERLFVEIVRDDRAEAAARPRGFFKVGFEVPDVEVVAESVGRATGEEPRVLDFDRHGVRLLQLKDPDGHVVQLYSKMERSGDAEAADLPAE